MFSPSAIDEFFNRPLKDYEAHKQLPKDKLESTLVEAGLEFSDDLKPRLHQLVSIYLCLMLKQFLLFLPTGTGKSFVMLKVLQYLKLHKKAKKSLILVPNVIAIPNWEAEFEKIAPDLKYQGLQGSAEKKWKTLFSSDADVFITNYMGLVAMLSVLVPNPKRKGKRKQVLDLGKIDKLGDLLDCIIYDESTALKNPKSLTFKVCKKLKDLVKYRYALTGTPFGRNPADLWSQFFVIDGGESLGYTYWFFMNAFFNQKKGFWGGSEWAFKKRKKADLNKMVRNRSITYRFDECVDIPPKTVIPIKLPMPEYLVPYYTKLKRQLKEINIAASKNLVPHKNVFLQARQMTSGFLTLREEGNGEKQTIKLPENIKLNATEMLLDELDGEKIVIFHDFNVSGDMLEELVQQKGLGYARVHGGTKDRAAELRKFLHDKKCQVFILNSYVGSMALNLQVAPYMLFYESPVSSIVREQCEARVYRSGQQKKTFLYDLVLEDTVDEKIQTFIKEGKDLYQEIMAGRVNVEDVI